MNIAEAERGVTTSFDFGRQKEKERKYVQRQKLAFENNSRVLSATKGRFMSQLVFCVMPHGSAFMSILQSDI